MKYLQALLLLALLTVSKRYRQKWTLATDRLSEANDATDASLRRLDALDNGGKPKIHLLKNLHFVSGEYLSSG